MSDDTNWVKEKPRKRLSTMRLQAILLSLFVPLVLVGCATTGRNPARVARDYGWVRGANYIPSYAATDVEIWKNFDPVVVDRELGYAADIGLNSVRVFLQYHVYDQQREKFLNDVAAFVDLCAKHGIRPMLVVFDSCMAVVDDWPPVIAIDTWSK